MKSENVRRTIVPWGNEGVTRAQARMAGAATAYHWAAFSSSLGDAELVRLAGFGIEVIGFAGRPGGYRVYKVRVKGDVSGAIASLKSMAAFINLLPVLPEEKVTRKVLRGEFRSKRAKGMVQATVVFHRNLGGSEAEALLKGKVERILPEARRGAVDVVADPRGIQALMELDEVARVEDFQEPLLLMERARDMTRVSEAQWGMDTLTFPPTPAWNKGQTLTGDSIWVGIAEAMDENHLDLRESVAGGTVRRGIGENDWTSLSGYPWHGTIVAGIAVGNGWNSEYNGLRRYERRGVAPKAKLIGYSEHGDVNNHSRVNETRGYYGWLDAFEDDRVSRHSAKGPEDNNVSVWAAGNNGESSGDAPPQLGYYSMMVNAKNPIKVGAVDRDGIRAGFSGIGPMRDGRLGPDVMAPGAPVTTIKIRTQGYDNAWGTSFAAPVVTGIAALMLQKYKEQMMRNIGRGSDIHDHPMWNSTVRAILAHTARDMSDMQGVSPPNPEFAANGYPGVGPLFGAGPDFVTGYGLVDAKSALDYVNDNGFKERKINSGSTTTWDVTVPAGQAKLSVTLAWDDPGSLLVDEATAYDSKLVNDLNLRIVGPAGQVYTAMAPDHSLYHNGTVPANGMDPVTPHSVMLPGNQPPRQDDVGNLEHISVPSPQAGVWRIEVQGTDIALDQSEEPGVNQDYSLVSNVPLPSTAPETGTDLIVSKVVVIPARPTAGQAVYFQATVTNRGHQATPDISHGVGFYSEGMLRAVGASQPLSLAAGQSTVITTQAPTPTGVMPGITARANHEGRFEEITLRNNPLSLPITQFQNIPNPWVSQSIGSVYPPGRVDLFGVGSYRIYSGGKQIGGTQDEFHFLHRPLSGPGEIRIHCGTIHSRSDTAKVALMIRESLAPGSKYVSIAITKAAGRVFQSRASDNGPTASTWTGSSAGTYLRLARSGNNFTAYVSADGSAWAPAGSAIMAMAVQVYAGIGFTSNQDSVGNAYVTPIRAAGGFNIGITGRIADLSGNGVSGASIALSGCAVVTAVTDASGNYAFPNLGPGGNCVVTPSHPSYAFHPPLHRFNTLYDSRAADFFAWNSPLPSPWISADIGAVGPAGGAFQSSGIFTIKGSGADIQGTADAFRLAHQSLSGDGEIRARVDALTPTDPFAKAGVMLRDGTGANARNTFMALTSSQGSTFQSRSAAGGATAFNSAAGIAAPYWVRLVRAGNVFTGYRSADGAAWTQQGQITLALPAALNAGLAVTSHNNALLGTGGFSQVSVTSLAFTEADIGAPGAVGGRTLNGDQHSVRGAGADIWGTSDAFHFSYQSLPGNGQITARVASLQNTNGWAKAGVMIREGLSANARNVFMAVTPSQGATFQRRLATGGTTTNTVAAANLAPMWVRLVRTETSIRAFRSDDGLVWELMGEAILGSFGTVHIGLAVTSHSNGVLATGVFENVQR